MQNKITLIVFRNSGSKVNQISFLKSSAIAASTVLALCFIGLLGIVVNYIMLRNDIADSEELLRNIANHQQEIKTQRVQIQKFGDEINILKRKLVDLRQFEKKIRIIANIEKQDDSESLFGIGGSIPEDLDIDISLEKKHDRLIRDMHEQVDHLEHASNFQLQELENVLSKLEEKRNLLASTPSIQPVFGSITSGFGYRQSPFTGRREMHKGLDIAAPKGTPIIATADGIVTFAGSKGLLGNTIVVDHGHGISTRYAHCSKILKSRGDGVKRGDIIARVGNTGRSTGPHLHYEVRINNLQVNPTRYILDLHAGRTSESAGS